MSNSKTELVTKLFLRGIILRYWSISLSEQNLSTERVLLPCAFCGKKQGPGGGGGGKGWGEGKGRREKGGGREGGKGEMEVGVYHDDFLASLCVEECMKSDMVRSGISLWKRSDRIHFVELVMITFTSTYFDFEKKNTKLFDVQIQF